MHRYHFFKFCHLFHMKQPYLHSNYLWCISIQNSLILLDIVICKGNYFQRKRKRGRSLFYIVCRKTVSQGDIPYSQKNMGMLSRTCRLVLSRILRIITMNKSLNILFVYIKSDKPTIFPNLNAKSVDFPVTGEVML